LSGAVTLNALAVSTSNVADPANKQRMATDDYYDRIERWSSTVHYAREIEGLLHRLDLPTGADRSISAVGRVPQCGLRLGTGWWGSTDPRFANPTSDPKTMVMYSEQPASVLFIMQKAFCVGCDVLRHETRLRR
jgi:hypothetical protein